MPVAYIQEDMHDHAFLHILPSVALCESQVHAMACEESAAVKWEFNAGRVRNGLTQQCQEAASRERGLVITAECLHVSCAMKDLGEEIEKCHLKRTK